MTLSVSESYDSIIRELEANSRPETIEGMAKYDITPGKAYGVSIPVLRRIAKDFRKYHEPAEEIFLIDCPAARWTPRHAIRELTGEKVKQKLLFKKVNDLFSETLYPHFVCFSE
jgi:hypothetical protein